MVATCLLLVSSGQNLKGGEAEIICIMQSQSVHLLVESLERKTAFC